MFCVLFVTRGVNKGVPHANRFNFVGRGSKGLFLLILNFDLVRFCRMQISQFVFVFLWPIIDEVEVVPGGVEVVGCGCCCVQLID